MKISCNVARDLLPLYHDGVCSDDSRALVEAHIRDCAECQDILKELRGEIEVPHEVPDDLAPLEKIEQNVKKGKKRAWLKGVAAVLAVVLIVFAGANVWWYVNEYSYYQKFAEGHEAGTGYEHMVDGYVVQTVPAERTDYVWSDGLYEFAVRLPEYLRRNGQVQVTLNDPELTRSIQAGRDVELALYIDQELYTYSVHLTVIDRTAVSGQAHLEETWTMECVMLDADLNQVYLDHWDEETIARQNAIYEEYYMEITRIVQAAQAEWPFLAE